MNCNQNCESLEINRQKINSQVVDVIIEISKNSHIKYEYDSASKMLKCDRILHTPFNYFFNYGFIAKTLSMDGDAVDVVVLMDDELIPGCSIQCKILGCLETSDDHGDDPKIIVCPTSLIDPTYTNINTISDIPKHTIDKIVYFFTHYKDLENKQVQIGKILDKEDAIHIYKDSIARFVKSTNPNQNDCIINSDGYVL
jgi:inorganic pyrophosphatase